MTLAHSSAEGGASISGETEAAVAADRLERFFDGPAAPFGVYPDGKVRAGIGADIRAVIAAWRPACPACLDTVGGCNTCGGRDA